MNGYHAMLAEVAATIAAAQAPNIPDRDFPAVARRSVALARLLVDLVLEVEPPA